MIRRHNRTTPMLPMRRSSEAGTRPARPAGALLSVLATAVLAAGASSTSGATEIASDWIAGHNVRTRMIGAGTAAAAGLGAAKPEARVVGVEVALQPGWKTYWRSPGDAGGVPPSFDWTGSRNLARATVLYPAPKRMKDRTGTTFGYDRDVVFPVVIEPERAGEPVDLALLFSFGICREICVPTEAALSLSVPADAGAPPAQLAAEIARVPRPAAGDAAGPRIASVMSQLDTEAPKVTIVAIFPGGAEGADLFVEEPGGEYVPTAEKRAVDGTSATFEIDLTQGADIAALRDRELVATLVGTEARTERRFRLSPP